MRDGYAEVVDPKSGVVGGVQDDYGEDTATEDQPVTPRAVSVASGYSLLRDPHHNKGLAFNEKERDSHYLCGLLPPHSCFPRAPGKENDAQYSQLPSSAAEKRKQCNRGVPEKKAESKSMSSTGAYNTREMEIIKGELMNVQENHFRNEVEDGNDSSIYTIFHVLLQCKLLCGHALGNQSSRGISGFAKNQATFVGKWDGSFFVLETNTLWFWKHLAHGCNVQNTGGALSVLVLFLLRSFILPKAQIPVWWSWGYLINQGLRQCYQLRCK
ncbi:hypothetical protein LWI29_020956 [Acer saccharum]|uniref:Uncharacterized protein n=1 Tax=Acer saccharum TaxID=4024 RepID=A0AA39VXT5_ACESA|nr:hypothetical protein LWI29_020956 [Acer saccharum]